jgi:hypothetical protein
VSEHGKQQKGLVLELEVQEDGLGQRANQINDLRRLFNLHG